MIDDAALASLTRSAPCGLALLDAQYRLLWINDYLAKLLGRVSGPVNDGSRLHHWVTPASRIFLQTRLQQELILGARVEELAIDLVGTDGRRHPVMVSAERAGDGAMPGAIQLCLTRAPVRRAYEAEVPKAREAALAEKKAAQAIIDGFVRHCPVPLVMTDRDLRITGVSRAWETNYGLSEIEMIGMRVDQRPGRLRPADDQWDTIYKRGLAGESLSSERPVLSAYGDHWFKWAVVPWRNASGEVGGLLLMNFDVSDLINARDAAAAADETKTRFLANMSHELRTPLNGMLAPLDLLRARAHDTVIQDQLDAVAAAGSDLSRVLNALLDFSQLQTGAFEPMSTTFDPGALARDLLGGAREMLGSRTVRLIKPIWGYDRGVVGDADAITRILSQLLSNAVKFTAAGEIGVEIDAVGEHLEITVRDTGCGFDAERFPDLVQAFHQGDTSRTRAHGGIGLGLTLAHHLTVALGGELSATSVMGQGSRVTVRLPFAWGEALGDMAKTPPVHEAAALRVLAVDDHPANLAVIQTILQIVEADVTCAINGLEAVDLARTGAFDLILMDVQMPVMDGLDAIRLIRAEEAATGVRVPIIVVSANVSRPEIVAALAAGADDTLGKPIGAAGLIHAMDQVLQRGYGAVRQMAC